MCGQKQGLRLLLSQLVVDNIHVKIRYTSTQFFHMFLKIDGFELSNCLNAKIKIYLECEIHNTA